MAANLGYRFGKSLGAVLIITYIIAAVMCVGGAALALDTIFGFPAWYYWVGTIVTGLVWLYFIPRPIDVLLLAPAAVYGGFHQLGLTWTMAMIIMAVPVLIVVVMSLGRK